MHLPLSISKGKLFFWMHKKNIDEPVCLEARSRELQDLYFVKQDPQIQLSTTTT